jgi:hypothetical protein
MSHRVGIVLQASIAAFAVAGMVFAAAPSATLKAAAASPSQAVSDLIDRALNGPAGPEDEGNYNLIDPIGPGANTEISAADEVFASTLIVAKYTPWKSYSDPFAAAPGTTPPPGPYSPSGPPLRQHRATRFGS